MLLSEALTIVTRLGYDHRQPKTQSAQQELYRLRREPPDGLPVGLELRVSGQGFSAPRVPWIALLDRGVTDKVTEGVYLVYLFSADLSRVYLTVNQGATQHRDLHLALGRGGRVADDAAIREIAQETRAIQEVLELDWPDLWRDRVELGVERLFLPLAYEAGAIASIGYDTHDLPGEDTLRQQLSSFNDLYKRVVSVKEQLVAAAPDRHRTSARSRRRAGPAIDPEPLFRPKDGRSYVRESTARRIVISPRHESLIQRFGQAVKQVGWTPATNVHPRDLVLTRHDASDWLVEAKTVGPNAELAVREAIGQLFSYRHFFYRLAERPTDPKLLALFDAPIGDAFVQLLESLSIEALWSANDGWSGTPSAMELLSDPPDA